ncbi:unnamed protein product [Dovyalis caffra]|uniref:Uncharacterized protein n=1 Tax=Dovyalis caffra TaxID=77055 RepID=A0AAV1RW45_9ROSI|nr:unnamed protein product [Dovyalis caffra]
MACQGNCSSKSACNLEVPTKEEVTTQPETVVQEAAAPAVAPEEVKTEEKAVAPEEVKTEERAVAPEEVKSEKKDASNAKKEEEPAKVEAAYTMNKRLMITFAFPAVSVKTEEKPAVPDKKEPLKVNNAHWG